MLKANTHSKLIGRYDNVVPVDVCNLLVKYITSKIDRDKNQYNGMPWHNNDSIQYADIDSSEIRFLIDAQRFVISQLVCDHFKEVVFPHFTDLVVWRKGMKMSLHKDNGYDKNDEDLRPRKYSAVTYLNDDYVGGETVIKQTDKQDYISVPRQGSVVLFKSNEECLHGVNEIEDGIRFTLASWYTTDYKHFEFVYK